MKAMLIDSTRCVGCHACQVACKQWNELEAEETTFFAAKGYQNPRDLSANTWTLITYNEVEVNNRFDWVFGKLQCFHCITPACASACPFKVPKFEWNKIIPEITKCTMCFNRVAAGLEPACAKVCPTDAIVFGKRDELIEEAESRIRKNPTGYVHHIFGKDEAGGTCVMHISNVPFEEIGFDTKIPMEPIVSKAEHALKPIPYVLTGLGLVLVLGGVSWVVNRKKQLSQESQTGKED